MLSPEAYLDTTRTLSYMQHCKYCKFKQFIDFFLETESESAKVGINYAKFSEELTFIKCFETPA
jgi:hypothetical protein